MNKTGFLFHELYMWHDNGSAAVYLAAGGLIQPMEHVETPETKRRFRNLLEACGLLDSLHLLKPGPASHEDLLRFHSKDYIARVKQASAAGGGELGDFAPIGAGGYEIALLSAGGAVVATEAVLKGDVDNAYALVRPPGHHAEANRGRGFCILGNLVVAAMAAQARHGVGRIMTVDWDVHHGNGTQSAFYNRSDVLTISVHQDGLYPFDSGACSEIGTGAGEGYNINVPLPAGSGHGAYMAVMDRVILPAADRFKPELIMVSSGFDSCVFDPLGRMLLHSDSYREMTRLLMQAADAHCGSRLVLLHEGGYSAGYVPFCGLAVMEQLCGEEEPREDPFAFVAKNVGQNLMPQQEAVIDRSAELVARLS